MRQVVVVMPSAFTLGNLFFGFWAIVSAFNGNFRWAAGSSCSPASSTCSTAGSRGCRTPAPGSARSSTRWWTSISFGLAPALIMYFLDFATAGRFAWILCYIYVVARGAPAGALQRAVGRQADDRLVHRAAVARGRA